MFSLSPNLHEIHYINVLIMQMAAGRVAHVLGRILFQFDVVKTDHIY